VAAVELLELRGLEERLGPGEELEERLEAYLPSGEGSALWTIEAIQ
jgi:hypothetical protein